MAPIPLRQALTGRQHQPAGQIRLDDDQDPAEVEHQAEEDDAAEAIEELPGAAGIEHLADRLVERVGGGAGEYLHPLKQPALGSGHAGCSGVGEKGERGEIRGADPARKGHRPRS